MGEYVTLRRRRNNVGKSRKITREKLDALMASVIKTEKLESHCGKCIRGYYHIPKEPIGFDVEACDCIIENESLNYSQELFKKSALPKRLEAYSMDKWSSSSITFELLLDFISGNLEKKWMFLTGTVGTGKTFTAIICAKIALLQEKSVYFTSVTKLLDDLRPDESSPGRSSAIMKRCLDADLLILDDIGHEKSSQWVREKLYIIVNERWNSMKATIFTSNFDIENTEKTISPAVHSRVRGESILVRFNDSDRRLIP